VFVFATSLGMMPSQQTFVAGPEWERHAIPLARFAGADPKAITGIFFGASPDLGPFRFRIDDVAVATGQASP